jgi:uncharacterized protein YjbJ (UPF0337 family)
MFDNIAKGRVNQVKGKVKKTAGKLSGNKSEEMSGKADSSQKGTGTIRRDKKKYPQGYQKLEALKVLA